MVNYIPYEPKRTMNFEPRLDGRHFFGAGNVDWVQILPINERLNEPFRFCASIGGQLVGATSLHGKPNAEDAFLIVKDGKKLKQFIKVEKVPAAVFERVVLYSPEIIKTADDCALDSTTLSHALNAMSGAMIAHSSKYPPRDVSGLAVPESVSQELWT